MTNTEVTEGVTPMGERPDPAAGCAMTATAGDEPGPAAGAEARWQRIEDRLAAVGHRMRTGSDAAIASIDGCLARLDALCDALRAHAGQETPGGVHPPDQMPTFRAS
ncbi:hypothetical protein [Kitasatospora sp. NPDC015120]|uniref:hypothetical protein n=1 Tax=Kitasatospora sp. NPDC015120 TaxID=3364023 RepID=UPI0036F4A84D